MAFIVLGEGEVFELVEEDSEQGGVEAEVRRWRGGEGGEREGFPLADGFDGKVDFADAEAGVGAEAAGDAAVGAGRMMVAQAGAGVVGAKQNHHQRGQEGQDVTVTLARLEREMAVGLADGDLEGFRVGQTPAWVAEDDQR